MRDRNGKALAFVSCEDEPRDQSALAVIFLSDLGHQFVSLFFDDSPKTQNVMAVTDPPSRFWETHRRGEF